MLVCDGICHSNEHRFDTTMCRYAPRMRSKTILPHSNRKNLLSNASPRAFLLRIVRSLASDTRRFVLSFKRRSLWRDCATHASRAHASDNERDVARPHRHRRTIYAENRIELYGSCRWNSLSLFSFHLHAPACRATLHYRCLALTWRARISIELRAGIVWTRCVDEPVLVCFSAPVKMFAFASFSARVHGKTT